MTVSLGLAASLLLALWSPPCSAEVEGGIEVQIFCSLDWVMVSVSPHRPSRSNPYMFADELTLGLRCPATEIQTYMYHFVYLVSACGIKTQVLSEESLLIETELHYTPRRGDGPAEMTPLACLASRRSVWITSLFPEDDVKLQSGPFTTDFQTTPEELGLLKHTLLPMCQG